MHSAADSGDGSDDEVIFVEERKVISGQSVSVKSEPEPATEKNTNDVFSKRNEEKEAAEKRANNEESSATEGAGRPAEGSARVQDAEPVAEQHIDHLSVAVRDVIRSLETEGTDATRDAEQVSGLPLQSTAPVFKNKFTPQFIGPPKYFDTTILSGNHLWNTNEVSNIPFHKWVTNNRNPRTDMQFFRELYDYHPTVAKNSWAHLRENVLYVIPESLQCSRSFARELLEVYYLDRTDGFLDTVALKEISVQNIPLLEDRITDRQWNVFSKRPGHFQELYNRREHKIWLPHDQPEISTYSVEDLLNDYPKVEQWFHDLEQPSGLPIPCPPVLYYYHQELACGDCENGCTTRQQKLQAILRLEFASLFLCTWFMECALGGRNFLLKRSTVEMIAQCLEDRPNIIRDVSTSYILNLMRQGGEYDSQLYNTFRYVKTSDEYYNMYRKHEPPLPDCTFLSCYKGSGIIMTRAGGGQIAYQTLWCRRMNMAVKQSRKSEREWNSPLDAILSAQDLDRLPELRALIRARGWDQNSELCVYDLFRNLLDINSRSVQTNIQISSGSTSLRKERDSLARILNRAIDGPPHRGGHDVSERVGERRRYSAWNNEESEFDRDGNWDISNDSAAGHYWSQYGMERTDRCGYRSGMNSNDRWDSDHDFAQPAQKRPKRFGNDGCGTARERREPEDSQMVPLPTRTQPSHGGSVNDTEIGNLGKGPSTSGGASAERTAEPNSSGPHDGNPSIGKTSIDAPSGGLMPAFQPRKSSRKSTVLGGRYPSTPFNQGSRPATPGTPIPEVDITGTTAEGGPPNTGIAAAPHGLPRHPWGFSLR